VDPRYVLPLPISEGVVEMMSILFTHRFQPRMKHEMAGVLVRMDVIACQVHRHRSGRRINVERSGAHR
jgi:hypothetical protein